MKRVQYRNNPMHRQKKKFMFELMDSPFFTIRKFAISRGITIQEALRAIIIPEFLEEYRRNEKQKRFEKRVLAEVRKGGDSVAILKRIARLRDPR